MVILDQLRRRIEMIEHRRELEAIEAAILELSPEARGELVRLVEMDWLAEGRELKDLHHVSIDDDAYVRARLRRYRDEHRAG